MSMLCLASSSPRRMELLSYTPYLFYVDAPAVEEMESGAPDEVVRHNALMKARAAARAHPGDVIVAADTVVYLPREGRILGKPSGPDEAREMLCSLSGSMHEVYTGICVKGPEECVRTDKAQVWFTDLTHDMIEAYIATGEPLDKAGAYAVQGRGGIFVSRLEGSPSCVIGLSMHVLYEMLHPFRDLLPQKTQQ